MVGWNFHRGIDNSYPATLPLYRHRLHMQGDVTIRPIGGSAHTKKKEKKVILSSQLDVGMVALVLSVHCSGRFPCVQIYFAVALLHTDAGRLRSGR